MDAPLYRTPSPTARPMAERCFWLFSVIILAGMLFYSADFGVTFDEMLQNEYGKRVLAYYESFFRNRSFEHYANLYYYGGLFDLLAAILERWHVFSAAMYARHFLNAFFGWIAILFAGMTAKRVAGPIAGILALLLMVANPIFLGHAMNNPKDIPFAAFFTMTLYCLMAIKPTYPYFGRKDIALIVMATALALNVRVAAMMLFGEWALFLGLAWLADRPHDMKKLGSILARWALMVAVAVPLGTLFWPWAQSQPFTRPFQALIKFSHFADWNFPVLFQGEWPRAADLPWYFLFTHLGIQMPPILFLGLLATATCLLTRHFPHRRQVGLIFAFTALPLLYVLISRPILYDGLRHFLFIIPPMVVLAALGLHEFVTRPYRRRGWHLVAGLILAVGVAEPLLFNLRWHPYQSVYFSPLIGGPAKAFKRYEMDFWGTCVGEALQWVDDQPNPHPGRRKVVGISMWPFWEFYREVFPRLEYNDDRDNGDYKVIVMRNQAKTLQRQLDDPSSRMAVMVDHAPLCLVQEGKHQVMGQAF